MKNFPAPKKPCPGGFQVETEFAGRISGVFALGMGGQGRDDPGRLRVAAVCNRRAHDFKAWRMQSAATIRSYGYG